MRLILPKKTDQRRVYVLCRTRLQWFLLCFILLCVANYGQILVCRAQHQNKHFQGETCGHTQVPAASEVSAPHFSEHLEKPRTALVQSLSFAISCSEEISLYTVVTPQTSNLLAVLGLPRAAESQGWLPLEAQGHKCQQGESFRQMCH